MEDVIAGGEGGLVQGRVAWKAGGIAPQGRVQDELHSEEVAGGQVAGVQHLREGDLDAVAGASPAGRQLPVAPPPIQGLRKELDGLDRGPKCWGGGEGAARCVRRAGGNNTFSV